MAPLIPVMTPAPGDRLQRFVGDVVRFVLRDREGRRPAPGWCARLRTNLGRARLLRQEILQAHTGGLPLAGGSWRDLPMKPDAEGWSVELPLSEVGFFSAKAFLLDPQGWQQWPEGPDAGISVHPNAYRTANTIYCAFTRLFGESRTARSARDENLESRIKQIEQHGFSTLPPSGKLRDLIPCLPHIIDGLGCRILHLLPVNPTPTTYARFGRFGSPYAALDLTAIDPALVVFDRRTTGVDQFHELTFAAHLRGGRVFLDIVINHTGWGSALQERHPEWFVRHPDGGFASPGAWGNTWEDLVELKHENVALWDKLAVMFLTWCRRGVDGFRCDAGYKVPARAWQYIVARVQQEFPETVFLLEGLGGSWEATETLLTEGGMQWAYSELFQNHSGPELASYLDHSLKQSRRAGLLVNYSETHDNDRLAKRGRPWALLRNRLCALTSVNGGFGFTCGVEWLATEKIKVHERTGLAWGDPENLVPELAQLNRLLAEHPCFLDGAILTRLSPADSPVYALLRESAEGSDMALVLVNSDIEREQIFKLNLATLPSHPGPNPQSGRADPALAGPDARQRVPTQSGLSAPMQESQGGGGSGAETRPAQTFPFVHDLLRQSPPEVKISPTGEVTISLPPGAAYCLSPAAQPRGLSGEPYRRARAQAAWAVQALNEEGAIHEIGQYDWRALAEIVNRSPCLFLAAIRQLGPQTSLADLQAALATVSGLGSCPNVVRWSLLDCRRVTPVPPGHWLFIEDAAPFRASLEMPAANGEARRLHVESIGAGKLHVCCFTPQHDAADATLFLERYADKHQRVEAAIRFLASEPPTLSAPPAPLASRSEAKTARAPHLVLLTNGIGGMARMGVDLGRVTSKYDCVLGANLHPGLPVDRHIFAKRIRVWVDADGFISPLDLKNLGSFKPGPPAFWRFVANAGDGRTVEIDMRADMLEGKNTTVFHFSRPSADLATGKQLPAEADVRLTVRVDIEDRNFHWETRRNGGAEFHFSTHTHEIRNPKPEAQNAVGFAFTPAPDRHLRVFVAEEISFPPAGSVGVQGALNTAGVYHAKPEWSENIPHPVEQSRGQVSSGDAYSPGWFELSLPKGGSVALVVTAESSDPDKEELESSKFRVQTPQSRGTLLKSDVFGQKLLRAARAFVVRRGAGRTVIAGYPWFLDWGRDTLICARGLLAAGLVEEVKEIVLTFARFEKDGTLPNTIHGEDASNRDTSDAPLWFGVVCEELAKTLRDAGNSMLASGARRPIQNRASGNEHRSDFYSTPVDPSGRTLRDVLWDIAVHYAKSTPNGIRMDPESALIWSPSHFTWMDTNHPAATPREGYPVEIQALWIRLLRQLEHIGGRTERPGWNDLADKALASFERYFWLEDRGYYADLLIAQPGQTAAQATTSDALRSNCLFPVSLGLVQGERAKRCVEAARRYLVIPGALRSLAPLPVSVPLPVAGRDGRLLNNPAEPYWGHYEGDEDTRRKPAYHNGTAWTWTFPVFCEALVRAWDGSPDAVAAARAYLGSMDQLLNEGCLGQIPEILDGDAPHAQRGCDAQAWGVTEALRVWKLFQK
jgi:starch synthase (maltosyl-transferring)